MKTDTKRHIILVSLLFITIIIFLRHIIRLDYPPKLLIWKHDANYPPVGAIYVGFITAGMMLFYTIILDLLIIRKLQGWKKIIGTCIAVFLFFGILEVSLIKFISRSGLRYRPHPYMLYEIMPPWKVKKNNINSKQMRYREFPEKKGEKEFRFIVLGDSTAHGLFVRDGYRFSDVLEKKLQEHYKDKVILVINAAVEGYSIFQARELYDNRLKKYSPDCIIISINNDGGLKECRDEDRALPIKFKGLFNLLYKSETYLLIRKLILFREAQKKVTEAPREISWRVPEEDVKRHYKYLIEDIRKRGGHTIVLSMPMSKEWLQDQNYIRYRQVLEEIYNENGCIFIDFYHPWKADREKDRLFVDACHLNDDGHRLMGETIYDIVVKSQIIK